MLAKLTLIGMNEYDATYLWSHFSLPEGLDEELAKDVIMESCGSLPLLHPDLHYLSWRIGVFCKKHKWTFEKWQELLEMDYDPLTNYDRKEEWTDEGENSSSGKTESSSETSSETSTEIDTTVTHKVSAYNSSSFEPATEDITDGSTTGSGETSGSSTVESSDSGTNKNTHKGRISGNIGVTTSQKMWMDQADLVRFNVYENIAKLFKREFCLGVYV